MGQLEDARNKVANQYGKAIAQKASDAFLVAFGSEQKTASLILESARSAPLTAGTILEFAQPPDAEAANLPREATKAAMEEMARHVPVESVPRVVASIRQSEANARRDVFYHQIGAIRGTIERSTSRNHAESGNGPVSRPSISRTQVCWLNHTVRSWADPRILAEIADEPTLLRLDLPRPIEKELKVTGVTVGAIAYRKAHSLTAKGVTVAVIDMEVSLTHPALKGRVVQKNNYTKEAWGNPGDHGTAVAGIIGGEDVVYAGMAPEVTIYNYKVMATVDALNADDFGGTLAIQQALEDGADIANCSWGTGPAGAQLSREARACDAAWAAGLTIVKSAGNKGPGAGTITSPGEANGIIVVGATNQSGTALQDYSSRGPTGGGLPRPHLCAPGGTGGGPGMTSCDLSDRFSDVGWGTSYAAPHVSGLIALLLQQNPLLDPDGLRQAVIAASQPFNPPNANGYGAGLVVLT